MWPVVYNLLLRIAAVVLVGLAIRLMDDAQDLEVDRLVGRNNLAAHFSEGTTAYALAALTLAVLCSPATAVPLFVAAYATGMAGDLTILPTKLPAMVEGIALWTLAMLRYGWRLAIAALLIILAVQLMDDWLDRSIDMLARTRNWTRGLGLVGTWLIVAACAVGALLCDPCMSVSAALVFLYFQYRELVVRVV